MKAEDKIYVAGHTGMVGSAILRLLGERGYHNFLLESSSALDLRKQQEVHDWFDTNRPKFVFLAAARVGGILTNKENPATFIYDNLMIQTNVIHAAYKSGVEKILFLGSSCIYPKLAKQPIHESSLLKGQLEETNRAYAIAKIAGIEMCQSYHEQYGWRAISVMPCNLYGYNDNYDLATSHVLPALVRKFIEAKAEKKNEVVLWGTGSPLREFLHVDDLAEACLFLMDNYEDSDVVNVGSGKEISIKELALMIKELVGYDGKIVHDLDKPDGTPRKLMDSSRLNNLGWNPKISLQKGLEEVIKDYETRIMI